MAIGWVMAGAAVLGAGASLAAADKQASALKRASNQSAATADQQIALQREMYDKANEIMLPYEDKGRRATSMVDAAMGMRGEFADQRAYDAARQSYDQGYENSVYNRDAQYAQDQAYATYLSTKAAMGTGSAANSGKALRALNDISLGARSSGTANYLNVLGGYQATGLDAAKGRASGGTAFATGANNYLAAASTQQNQYALAAAEARAQGWTGAASAVGYGLGQWAYYKPNHTKPTGG